MPYWTIPLIPIGLLTAYLGVRIFQSKEFASRFAQAKWNIKGRLSIKTLGLEKTIVITRYFSPLMILFGVGLAVLDCISYFVPIPPTERWRQEMNRRALIPVLSLTTFMLLLMACGSDTASPLPTYTPYPTHTPYPVPTPEVIIKEVPVEVVKEVIVEKIVEVEVPVEVVKEVIVEKIVEVEVPVELVKEVIVEKIVEVVVAATPTPSATPTPTPTPIPTPVLDVQLIPSLIENNSQNITNDIWDSNWIWSEQSWDATSTGRISQTLIRQDDSLIAIVETSNCIRNSSSNSLGDDCDRSIRRSQIRNHQSFQINTSLIYKFAVSKILTHGNSEAGNYIDFFEIKPWTDGITFTVPTMALYVNPQTNQMSVIQSLGNHAADPNTQNDMVEPLGKLLEGWNDFQIHMRHSANSDGYLKIYQNEQVIYDYKGKTSYEHSRPIKYWVGPYICCGKIDSLPNEPNHIFVYKNVIAEES